MIPCSPAENPIMSLFLTAVSWMIPAECVGDGNTPSPLWFSSCSHSCSVSMMNPVLHKDTINFTHCSTLLSAPHSFGESSLFIPSLDLKSTPIPLKSLFLSQEMPSFGRHFCSLWWGNAIAFIRHRLESGLHRKTKLFGTES